jgi:hypothetical protein
VTGDALSDARYRLKEMRSERYYSYRKDTVTVGHVFCCKADILPMEYEGVSKSFRTGRLERERQMV